MTELILTIGILQFLIPLLLLFWQSRVNEESKVLWFFKTVAVFSYLAAIAVAGLWNILPVFLPYLFLVVSLLLAVRGFLQIRRTPFLKAETNAGKIKLAATVLLAVLVSALTIYALSGWRIPSGETVRLHFPLHDGAFYVANGGSLPLLNAHLETDEGERFRPFRGQSYGVDVLQTNRFGFRANGFLPTNPAEYKIFGTPVYAPCDGTIVQIENLREDLSPPQMDETARAGNHVVLDCGEFVVLLAHFKKGGVIVQTGQIVEVGQLLAEVGNTGETGEPHLHIHAQRRGSSVAAFDGEPLWILFADDGFLVRNQILWR